MSFTEQQLREMVNQMVKGKQMNKEQPKCTYCGETHKDLHCDQCGQEMLSDECPIYEECECGGNYVEQGD